MVAVVRVVETVLDTAGGEVVTTVRLVPGCVVGGPVVGEVVVALLQAVKSKQISAAVSTMGVAMVFLRVCGRVFGGKMRLRSVRRRCALRDMTATFPSAVSVIIPHCCRAASP